MSKLRPVRHSWYNLWAERRKTLFVDLYQCEDEVPPTRCTANVKRLGTLQCNVDVEYKDLPYFESKRGRMMRKLSYEIELVPSGASAEFFVYVNGEKQDSKGTKIHFD